MPVLYNGGAVLANVEITTIYLGINVTQSDGTVILLDPRSVNIRCTVEDFVADLVNSAYMNMLGNELTDPQAPVIGRGKWLGPRFMLLTRVVNWDGSISDFDFVAAIQAGINDGTLPQPNPNTCYMIIYPGVLNNPGLIDAAAYHTFFQSDTTKISYIIIPDKNASPSLVSHEIAEAVSDPYNDGWLDPNIGNVHGEIADLCEGSSVSSVIFHGQAVSTFWSPSQNKCIGPADDGSGTAATQLQIQMSGAKDCFGTVVQGTHLTFTVTVSKNGAPILPANVEWSYAYPPGHAQGFVGPVLKLRADKDEGILVTAFVTDDHGCFSRKSIRVLTVSAAKARYHGLFCSIRDRLHHLSKYFWLNPIWDPSRDFKAAPISPQEIEATREFAQELLRLADVFQSVYPITNKAFEDPTRSNIEHEES